MTTSYKRFSGICGVLAGLTCLLYLVLFIIYSNPATLLPTPVLLAVSLLASPLLVGLYLHLRYSDEGYTLLGLRFGTGGAGGVSSAYCLICTSVIVFPSSQAAPKASSPKSARVAASASSYSSRSTGQRMFRSQSARASCAPNKAAARRY